MARYFRSCLPTKPANPLSRFLTEDTRHFLFVISLLQKRVRLWCICTAGTAICRPTRLVSFPCAEVSRWNGHIFVLSSKLWVTVYRVLPFLCHPDTLEEESKVGFFVPWPYGCHLCSDCDKLYWATCLRHRKPVLNTKNWRRLARVLLH